MGEVKKHFRVDSESVMSALKLCFFILAVLAMPALAQTPSEQNSPTPITSQTGARSRGTSAERDIPFSRPIPGRELARCKTS